MNSPTSTAHQRGLTLIELLISMALGVVLTLGISEIYINSKQTYRMQDGLARMQESARFALGFISKDIRHTGYIGCGNITVELAINHNRMITSIKRAFHDQVTQNIGCIFVKAGHFLVWFYRHGLRAFFGRFCFRAGFCLIRCFWQGRIRIVIGTSRRSIFCRPVMNDMTIQRRATIHL